MGGNEGRAGLMTAVRNVAVGVVVAIVALAAGFGIGYFQRDKKVQELRQLVAGQKERFTAQVRTLEKQALEAQRSHLERALARAKLKADLDLVVESLAAAAAEVEQRNFGRALRKVGAAKGALTAAAGTSPAIRDALGAQLDEITKGLEQQDASIRDQMISLAKDLEAGKPPGAASQ
jgi:hypothetical protein